MRDKTLLLAVVTCFSIGFLANSLLFLGKSVPLCKAACEQKQKPCTDGTCIPCGNGDANGDGTINLADAVYLLQHLFQGGDPAIAISPPETGQTKCSDNSAEITCPQPGQAFYGQDGNYQTGCLMDRDRDGINDRFVDNNDGTVTDTCTGLMWQQDTADTNGDQQIDNSDRVTWQDALLYCENLQFAGHTDWRLPNVRELQSILDYGRYDPAIDPVFSSWSASYWSSTSRAYDPFYAWHVIFYNGHTWVLAKSDTKLVRAVRG